jgi:hypothetical protein
VPSQSWEQVLISSQADGTALASSTTPTSILPSSAKCKLWANYCEATNKILKITAHGRISTLGAAPGTLSLDVRFTDTVPATVSVFLGGAMTLNVTAQTNMHWMLEIMLHVRALGSATTLFGYGRFMSHAVIGSAAPTAGTAGTHMLPYNSAPSAGTAFRGDLENLVDLYATWSVNSASNSIQLHNYILESLS